jgi:hypothetical protein
MYKELLTRRQKTYQRSYGLHSVILHEPGMRCHATDSCKAVHRGRGNPHAPFEPADFPLNVVIIRLPTGAELPPCAIGYCRPGMDSWTCTQ